MNAHKTFCQYLGLLLFLFSALFSASVQADVVVIVSVSNPLSRISVDNIINIFLGKVGAFPNGSKATPIDQTEGSKVRDEFYDLVVNKTPAQLNAYWAKAIFSGDSFPPKLLDGNSAIKKAVANNPQAIGYIDRSALDSSVKVIFSP
jgi:ABC-type phosphate transport system substrate-binding protein